MRSWLTLCTVAVVFYGAMGLSACADGAFLPGAPPEDQVDTGPPPMPDLGPPPEDLGPPDEGPPDLGPPDLGPPDLGPCGGAATCCGDGIVQANEECEPGLPLGHPDRCPTNPGSDCSQTSGVMCIEGTNCQRRCVPENGLNPAQICP
jgi:hypothetical protein